MTTTTTKDAFWIDRVYDRDRAGPPPSRLRNYLDSRQEAIAEAIEFYGSAGWSAEIWRTATGPVMVPGYIRESGLIVSGGLILGDGPGELALSVDVGSWGFPGVRPAQLRQGWTRHRWAEDGALIPAGLRPGTVTVATIVRVLTPLSPAEAPDVDDPETWWPAAVAGLDDLVAQANAVLAPVLAALAEGSP